MASNTDRLESEALNIAFLHGPAIMSNFGLSGFHFSNELRQRLWNVLVVAARETADGTPPLLRVEALMKHQEASQLEEAEILQMMRDLSLGSGMGNQAEWYAREIQRAWGLRETGRVAQQIVTSAEQGDEASVEAHRGQLEVIRQKVELKPKGLQLWPLSEILTYQDNPDDDIWPEGLLSAGNPTAIIGAPQAGKSRLTLQGCLYTITGQFFLGWKTRSAAKRWLFLQTENSRRRLKSDLQAMLKEFSRNEIDLIDQNVRFLDIESLGFSGLCMVEGHPGADRILHTIGEFNPDVVVIDPLRDAAIGDLNKDEVMVATCNAIRKTVCSYNPRCIPLIVHHGRTGACEASRVFGDDAQSFGRNSKALNGFIRSQINVALAGIEHPGIVIFGCGKNSNGPSWTPFAARLNPNTFLYERLEPEDFDLDAWSANMSNGKTSKKAKPRSITPEQVAQILKGHGGSLKGGVNAVNGLCARIQEDLQVSRNVAVAAIDSAIGITIQKAFQSRPGRGGAKSYDYVLLEFQHSAA